MLAKLSNKIIETMNNKIKLCYIGNVASHYRKSIFLLMDEAFDCDWVFGDSLGDIKQMDTSDLKGGVDKVKNINLFGGKAYWQKGVLKHLFRNNTHYLMIGDERCLSAWLLLMLSRLMPKKKVFLWTHGAYGKEGRLKRMVEWVFAKMSDGEFIYNNYSRNIMIGRGQNPEKLFTIHNSLDYENQLALRKLGLSSTVYEEHFGNKNHVLLFIGRLTKVKKLDQLIDAVRILKEQGNNYNLVFVGDGTERLTLRERVVNCGLESNVWFYGACYDEKTNAELIYNADLCVAPGNVGLTAMYTMVFGTPVISHNNFPWQMPEFEAIHPGETGDFFVMDSVDSLAETIKKWFATKTDRETIRRACYHEIDSQWTPKYQMEVLKNHLI